MSYFLPQLVTAVVVELALLVVLIVAGFDKGVGRWIVTAGGIGAVPILVFLIYARELAKVGSGWGNGDIYIVWMITLPIQFGVSIIALVITRRILR